MALVLHSWIVTSRDVITTTKIYYISVKQFVCRTLQPDELFFGFENALLTITNNLEYHIRLERKELLSVRGNATVKVRNRKIIIQQIWFFSKYYL